MQKRFALLIFFPLLLGSLCYVFFRTGSWLADIFPLSIKVIPDNKMFLLFIGILPDFLWAFSLGAFLYSFEQYREKCWYSLLILALLLVSELIQMHLSRFVFDYFDLAAAFLAWMLSYSTRNLLYER